MSPTLVYHLANSKRRDIISYFLVFFSSISYRSYDWFIIFIRLDFLWSISSFSKLIQSNYLWIVYIVVKSWRKIITFTTLMVEIFFVIYTVQKAHFFAHASANRRWITEKPTPLKKWDEERNVHPSRLILFMMSRPYSRKPIATSVISIRVLRILFRHYIIKRYTPFRR